MDGNNQIVDRMRRREGALRHVSPRAVCAACLIILLFLTGIIYWLAFFNFGAFSFKALDWPKEYKYYLVLKQSLAGRILPYHVSEFFQGTNRFLALPETNLSPQVMLLAIMTVPQFIIFNTLFLYSAGFIGCLLIRRRYGLSLVPFTVLFLLFNFNGYIIAHLAAGHSMWSGYFLLPFFCLYLFELVEEKNYGFSRLKLSCVLCAVILQGALHIFIWCFLFMLFFAVFNRKFLGFVVSVLLVTLMLAAFRLIPAALTFYHKGYPFITGYPTLLDMLRALTVIGGNRYPYLDSLSGKLGSCEYDIYVGVTGFAVIAYFGIFLRFAENRDFKSCAYKEMDMPAALMTVLSLGSLYGYIARLPVPFFNAERISTRFLIIPLLILLVISCIRMQKVVNMIGRTALITFIAALGLAVMSYELTDHARHWRLALIERYFYDATKYLNIRIIVQPDPSYKAGVKIALLISAVSAVLCVLYARWKRFWGHIT